jgi:outer membrane protein TolC
MKASRYLIIGALALVSLASVAQQSTQAVVLNYDAFMERVMDHHPIALRAELRPQRGEAAVRQARGAFDPRLMGTFDSKHFDDKNYFDLMQGALRVPTWFGIELNAAFEQNRGVFLNPENSVPDGGLGQVGIFFPVGRGLFIDERRAALRRAQLFEKATGEERLVILNNLLFEAGNAYWDWYLAAGAEGVREQGLALATERFEAIKITASLGDRPFIDTLEAGIQVQDRMLDLQQARLQRLNAAARLAVFLWQDGLVPLELSDNALPAERFDGTPTMPEASVKIKREVQVRNHPEAALARIAPEMLDLEVRLRTENLKPLVNLKYNALNEPLGNNPFAEYSSENYKWGVQFAFPLFLRAERGALQMARVMQREAELDLKTIEANLMARADIAINDWGVSEGQARLAARTAADYGSLLDGERTLFINGESSLFMVNARETAYINAEIRRLQLLTVNRKAELATGRALATLIPQSP